MDKQQFVAYVNTETGGIRYFDEIPEHQNPNEWKQITKEEYDLFFKVVNFFVPIRLQIYAEELERTIKRMYELKHNNE